MSWFSKYKNEWKEIIETVSREKKRKTTLIEKDIIQSMFLYELSQIDLPFVFKGGTSLSKAYNLIDRFSEDLDLSMNIKPTNTQKEKAHKAILDIAKSLDLTLSNEHEVASRHSYNKYMFKYSSLFDEDMLDIMVETSFYQKVYPIEKHSINSYVGEFCKENNISLPVPFNSEFEMNVQTYERTFVDKVFAVCDYRIQNMAERDSRHLYDIAKIYPYISFDKELDELIDNVRDERMLSKNNPSANLEYNINEMLKEMIDSRFYERDYKDLTNKLLYEEFSYDKAIEEGISKIINTTVFEYKKDS